MPTLPTAPDDALALSYGSSMTQDYKVRRVDFDDGYSQRAQKGLNSKPQQWKLTWGKVTDANAEVLRLFFQDLGGSAILTWQPFNQSVALKWTANGFSSRPSGFNQNDCAVTLTQEFDL